MLNKNLKNILIIHDIRSVTNVGAMFRTSDAVGINKIYLTGLTPTPLDRFGRVRKDMTKSALGAENFVPWGYVKNTVSLINKLKKEKYRIIGIEQSENSIDYKTLRLRRGQGNVFIVGAEVTGIPKKILKLCDIIAEIPMRGKKESLNVSVASGIALFRILGV